MILFVYIRTIFTIWAGISSQILASKNSKTSKENSHAHSKGHHSSHAHTTHSHDSHHSSGHHHTTGVQHQLKKPDFFIIGVQKGGTTSLHDLMIKNPSICEDVVKEKHFFNADKGWKKGLDYYRNMFSTCPSGRQSFDATPMFAVEKVPDRVKASMHSSKLAHAKFILILREPVSREFSYYQHQIRSCQEYLMGTVVESDREFAVISCQQVVPEYKTKGVAASPLSFRDYYTKGVLKPLESDYVHHLKNWLRVIGRNQILILNMQTLIKNTTDTMYRIKQFLGLQHGWGEHLTLPFDNNSSSVSAILDCKTFDDLKQFYDRRSVGLNALLRSPFRPKMEPPFPPFENTRAKCVTANSDTVSIVLKPAGTGKVIETIEKPDFFVIGAQKAATTSLHHLLIQNPGICKDVDKEKHFFDSDSRWDKGEGLIDYQAKFSNCPEGSLTFDMTPYFAVESVPERIQVSYSYERLKAMKFILILREPVSREFSYFRHRLRVCSEYIAGTVSSADHEFGLWSCLAVIPSFKGSPEAAAPSSFREYYRNGHMVRKDSDYEFHLKKWLNVILRGQLLILNMQSLVDNTAETMNRIQSFLGLQTGWGATVKLPHLNNSSDVQTFLDCNSKAELVEYYVARSTGLDQCFHSNDKPTAEPPFPAFDYTQAPCLFSDAPKPVAWEHHRLNSPDFFVLGAQKGATSSLYDLLIQSPEICSKLVKEQHFFDNEQIWSSNGASAHYEAAFQHCPNGTLTFDATPYFSIYEVPSRLQLSYSPSRLRAMKLILILREPVSREFSYFRHRLRACSEYLAGTISAADKEFGMWSCRAVIPSFDANSTVFVPKTFREYYQQGHLQKRDSDYGYHLQNWLKVIGRHQLLILNMESLISSTADTMHRIKDFLGLKKGWALQFPHSNNSTFVDATLDCDTYGELRKHYEATNSGLEVHLSNRFKPSEEPPFQPLGNAHLNCTDIHKHQQTIPVKRFIQKPDFFLLGAQNAGVGFLYDALKKSPEICGDANAEKNFFNLDESWAKGLDYYTAMFPPCQSTTHRFVDATSMLSNHLTPQRLQMVFGKAGLRSKKFVVVLDEPATAEVASYYVKLAQCSSHLKSRQRSQTSLGAWFCSQVLPSTSSKKSTAAFNPVAFKEYIARGRLTTDDGFYVDHLTNWLKYVDRSQMFIIGKNSLKNNTTDTLKAVSNFLGLSESLPTEIKYPALSDVDGKVDCVAVRSLRLIYNEHNKGLEKLVNRGDRPTSQPLFSGFFDQGAVLCL